MAQGILTRIRRSITLISRSNFHYYRIGQVHDPFWVGTATKSGLVYGGNLKGSYYAYNEIVIDDEYGIYGYLRRTAPRLIVDIGAHVGMFSKLCSLAFPEAVIYAYEPNPGSFKWLKQNCKGTRITPFEKAVLGRGGGSFACLSRRIAKRQSLQPGA